MTEQQAVEHHNFMTFGERRLGAMTANIAGPSRYQYACHGVFVGSKPKSSNRWHHMSH
jgi:hypothetical protein